MELSRLLEAKNELMISPATEINVRRLAEVLIVLEHEKELMADITLTEAEKEIVEDIEAVENYYMSYIESKRVYQMAKTEENKLAMIEKLKMLLSDMQEAISDIWSNADTAEEKQFIVQMVNKAYSVVK